MKWIRYACLFGVIMLLVGCGEKEMQDVKIGEVARTIFYAPLYAGIEQGFFEEEGLNIELTTIPGGDKTMTALLSDGIDIG
ncbi:MAG: ABC transporter substrate-binding protein, partial [Solibacillus sp.]